MMCRCARRANFVRGSAGLRMGDFTKLLVWRKAHAVALEIYQETARWPKHELFGLVSQARRAAASIPANIAEGCGKNSDAELARHARVSLGSASELSYYLILARDLNYLLRASIR
jgi:four helix bundle protein